MDGNTIRKQIKIRNNSKGGIYRDSSQVQRRSNLKLEKVYSIENTDDRGRMLYRRVGSKQGIN